MDRLLFFFIAGSCSSLLWPSLPNLGFVCLTYSLALYCLTVKKWLSLSGLLIGLAWMASVGHWQTHWQPSKRYFAQPVTISGEVLTLVNHSERIRFNLKVTNFEGEQTHWYQPKVRLSWNNPDWPVKQGQVVRLNVKLKPPQGLANENGFHYQQWLFSQDIDATGYVKASSDNQIVQDHLTYRQRVFDQINASDLSHKSWLAALGIGYRGLFNQSDWQVLQSTGTAHLVAISGMHLATVASISFIVFSLVLSLLFRGIYRQRQLNVFITSLFCAFLVAYIFASLAGFSFPTLRALLMMLIALSLVFLKWQWRLFRILLMTVALSILLFPLTIFTLSFWFSVLAVLTIVFILWRWPQSKEKFGWKTAFWVLLKMQLVLSLLMLPIVAWQMQLVSLTAPMVNIIAVPFVNFILLPCCLLGILLSFINSGWSEITLNLANEIMVSSVQFLQWVASHPFGHMELGASKLSSWLFFCVAVLWLMLPKTRIHKGWAVLLFLPLISETYRTAPDYWQIDVLDVGQGLSVLVNKNNRVMIYDTGPAYPSGFNMADAVIKPVLDSRLFKQIDYLLISHSDLDHDGSTQVLESHFPIEHKFTNRDVCVQGNEWQWQGLTVKVLWPSAEHSFNDNNSSCVVKVFDAHHSVLLPGDIERKAEMLLLDLYRDQPELLKADVLVVPHHGSKSSSSLEFLQAISPSLAIFSVGDNNRWKLPHKDVLSRFEQLGIKTFSTADDGQITLHFKKGKDIAGLSFRKNTKPYWYANDL